MERVLVREHRWPFAGPRSMEPPCFITCPCFPTWEEKKTHKGLKTFPAKAKRQSHLGLMMWKFLLMMWKFLLI